MPLRQVPECSSHLKGRLFEMGNFRSGPAADKFCLITTGGKCPIDIGQTR